MLIGGSDGTCAGVGAAAGAVVGEEDGGIEAGTVGAPFSGLVHEVIMP